MGKRGPAVGQYRQHTARDLDVVQRFQNGESLSEIGRSLGVTRERIRQVIWREVGENSRKIRASTRARIVAIKETVIPELVCLICHSPIPKRGPDARPFVTCGGKCAEDYRVVRYHVNEAHRERQEVRTALWVQAHPDKASLSQRNHAAKVLAGTPRRARRRSCCKGSKAAAIMAHIQQLRAGQTGDWHIEFPQAEAQP